MDEAKEEVKELVDFLREPGRFAAIGGRIPKGVLLVGPPGTGKTLLARSIAGEAKVPFLFASGSDFVEMYAGVGASRIRKLFKDARRHGSCIVFIDELDAVGRTRGGNSLSHEEREQTLNQLLVEMDGFAPNHGIVVVAATNRPDILDPALLRPGRFDRQVTVGAPDINGREQILRIHGKKVALDPDVDLRQIARGTPGFSGADRGPPCGPISLGGVEMQWQPRPEELHVQRVVLRPEGGHPARPPDLAGSTPGPDAAGADGYLSVHPGHSQSQIDCSPLRQVNPSRHP